MRLALFLAAAGAVAALPSGFPTYPDPRSSRVARQARYAALPADVKEENLQILFASALWRHGDRAAEHPVPGCEQFTEDDWTTGGGGYGELTPQGMAMHFNLGAKIRERYINTTFAGTFLSKTYSAKEIYIRSTDYNRTLISAYANVAGMYANSGEEDVNYPNSVDVPDWPIGYIPIPVHTVNKDTDYVGHPDSHCPRQDQIYDMVRQSAEYQSYIKDPQISQILAYLSDQTDSEVTIDNAYDLQDPIFCESNHIEELNQTGANIASFYPWFYTGNVPSWVDHIIDMDEDFTNGIANPGGVNGIDVSVELPKIRAGDTLKLLAENVKGVLACRDNKNDADACRPFYKQLKYYALSAHDTTVAAFLTILGVKKYVIPNSYPDYSAAVFFEVYEDNSTTERYFKVLYHANKDDDFKPITAFVRGCDPKFNVCPISVLYDLVAKYAPETDVATLCNTLVDGSTITTTAKVIPGQSTTPNVPTTTLKPTTPTTPYQNPTTSGVSSISLLSAVSVMIFSALL